MEIQTDIKKEFAPDKRVAIWEIDTPSGSTPLFLRGKTNLPKAKAALISALDEKGISYVDSIEMLPSAKLGSKTFALVNISVANIRTRPSHSAELTTQATLGTPLKVLEQDDSGDFYRVQTPDAYIAWVDHGGITRMEKEAMENYKSSEKVIYTAPFGFSYSSTHTNSVPVSDLAMGSILEFLAEEKDTYKVQYPDGREAYIPKSQASLFSIWSQSLNPSGMGLTALSKGFMGFPYLWGGTSPKGMDCSGFTKTLFFLNGMILPRDASQQVHVGTMVDDKGDFSKLQPGDLLFFYGQRPPSHPKGPSVVHVGMWIGNMEMIHASGKVHVSSFDPKAPNYDEKNHKRYYRTMRVLGEETEGLKYVAKGGLFE